MRPEGGAEELVDRPEVDGQRVDLACVVGVDAVLVGVEGGEAIDVLPHPFVGGVEQVRAVAVDLHARLRVDRGPGVAADVVAPLDDGHPHAEVFGCPAGHREAEESRSDDEEIHEVSFPSDVVVHATRKRPLGPAPVELRGV